MLAAHAAHATNAGHAGHAGHAEQAALAAHAVQAAHATRGRGVLVASGTQRGRHARAQAQARDKQEEGKRDTARGTALAASSMSFSGGGRSSKQRWGGAKMDARAVVLKELKSGRNRGKLAKALSLLTSLE